MDRWQYHYLATGELLDECCCIPVNELISIDDARSSVTCDTNPKRGELIARLRVSIETGLTGAFLFVFAAIQNSRNVAASPHLPGDPLI